MTAHRCERMDCSHNTYCDGNHPIDAPVHADAVVATNTVTSCGDLNYCAACLAAYVVDMLDPVNGLLSVVVKPLDGAA